MMSKRDAVYKICDQLASIRGACTLSLDGELILEGVREAGKVAKAKVNEILGREPGLPDPSIPTSEDPASFNSSGAAPHDISVLTGQTRDSK
jgi:hypothetical protein